MCNRRTVNPRESSYMMKLTQIRQMLKDASRLLQTESENKTSVLSNLKKVSSLKEQYPVTAYAPNFDVGKSKDARRVREP